MKGMDGLAHAREPTADSSWLLFDHVGGGVAVTMPDGTVEFCNAALLQLMGLGSRAPLGASIFELLEGGAGDELTGLHRAALATNTELRTQVRGTGGGFIGCAVLRRLERHDGHRVVWSFVDVRRDEPAPELALW